MFMRVPIILPELDVSPVRLSVWFADAGDTVYDGDRLVEVLFDGATFDVAAPAGGTLAEKCALPDDALVAGQVLGIIETATENGSAN
jgi:pyruvate/2-oxoglutarate dehydrogenase complex dihydrolipoamide acyltransferase (E2) component